MRRWGATALISLAAALLAPAVAAADWDAVARAPRAAIEGYTSEVSVLPGQALHLHVATSPAQSYRIEFYRVGWYAGAAPPLLACSPSCSGSVAGAARPVPAPAAVTGMVVAGWPASDTFVVPASWSSGYYVARLVLTSGPYAGLGNLVPFVVRAPRSERSAILVQAAVSTWQAYNPWGGKNLYPGGSTGGVPANRVSFDRPYTYTGVGGQSLFDWEIQVARFLEREGYDVSYTTDVDVARDPSSLLGHELDIVAGHDEYWSREQRDGYEAARDAGVDLAFIASNTGFWQVRYEDDYRTIVGYKESAPDPSPDRTRTTVMFRKLDAPRPECGLLGVQSHGGLTRGQQIDYALQAPSLGHRWYRNTGFAAGATLRGLVGYEWDGVDAACATPPLTVFFHYETGAGGNDADVTTYTAPSGARVFATGSMQYAWGLDGYGSAAGYVDPRLQQFTRNMLDDLGGPHAHDRSPPPASGDTRPPSVSISRPQRGKVVRIGRRGFVLRGRVRDPSGIKRVELALRFVPAHAKGRPCRFFDGAHGFRVGPCEQTSFFSAKRDGTHWQFRLKRSARLPHGNYFLRVRATDRAGNTNTLFSRETHTLVRFKVR
jgi:hypothetical protein